MASQGSVRGQPLIDRPCTSLALLLCLTSNTLQDSKSHKSTSPPCPALATSRHTHQGLHAGTRNIESQLFFEWWTVAETVQVLSSPMHQITFRTRFVAAGALSSLINHLRRASCNMQAQNAFHYHALEPSPAVAIPSTLLTWLAQR